MFGFIQLGYNDIGRVEKIISCILPTFSLGHLWYFIAAYESAGYGLTSESMSFKFSDENDFSMNELWVIMLSFTVLYAVLTLYFEKVLPSEFGITEPWYFPVSKNFWFPPEPQKVQVTNDNMFENITFEPLNSHEKNNITLKLMGLRKEFHTLDGLKVAVKNMYLDICHGEITAILGHNGAGKTTLMNMLTGMFSPTAGTAMVNGHDLITDMTGVRSSLGLCPQFNIFFPAFTIREHLVFFAGMKGVPRNEINKEVDKIIETLRFGSYANNFPTELSGGWKRRLSVAIALIGGSECVILDEPTSGMDPSTRRVLWNILKEIKHEKTIILSTHFMDEADILGDRVCIMSDGELQAAGTNNFLKDHFGCGYHLLLSSVDEEFSQYQVSYIEKAVKHYIPDMKTERCIGQEFNIILPFESVQKFEALFKKLDQEKANFGILSYGVMLTSMDEVFLKCTAKAKHENAANKKEVNIFDAGNHAQDFKLKHDRQTGVGLEVSRFKACLTKNIIYWIRGKWQVAIMILGHACRKGWGLRDNLQDEIWASK